MPLVAVYGSLRKGFNNHTLLKDCEQVGVTKLQGFKMHSLSAYPAVYHSQDDNAIITVEVYEVSDSVLERDLDRLEGHPVFYKREEVDTEFGKAWVYVMVSDRYRNNPIVEDGDWFKFKKGTA